MPAAKAPTISGMPTIQASTTPGSTAWLTASPISDQPFRTRKQESSAVGGATSSTTQKAFCMKGNWKGRRRFSTIIRALLGSGGPGEGRGGLAAGGEEAVLGGEEEGDQEDQRLQRDDDAAGGAVEEIAEIGADEAGQRADDDGERDERAESGR